MNAVETARDVLRPDKLTLPSKPVVLDIRVHPYVDHLGNDALKVWILLDNSTTRDDRTVDNRWAIKDAIRDALTAAGVDWFPYSHFATPSELEEAGIEV